MLCINVYVYILESKRAGFFLILFFILLGYERACVILGSGNNKRESKPALQHLRMKWKNWHWNEILCCAGLLPVGLFAAISGCLSST